MLQYSLRQCSYEHETWNQIIKSSAIFMFWWNVHAHIFTSVLNSLSACCVQHASNAGLGYCALFAVICAILFAAFHNERYHARGKAATRTVIRSRPIPHNVSKKSIVRNFGNVSEIWLHTLFRFSVILNLFRFSFTVYFKLVHVPRNRETSLQIHNNVLLLSVLTASVRANSVWGKSYASSSNFVK